MDLFVPKFIRYQLYLLQLENYELGRYWKLLIKKGIFPKKSQPLRKELVWTAKARALMLMAVALHGLFVILAGLSALSFKPGLDNFFTAVIFAVLILLPFYFVFFSLALLVLKPLDSLAKNQLIRKARAKIERLEQPMNRHTTGGQTDAKGLKIIGVAGSYGKTTMKEVLRQVLSIKYKVLSTPESVNTPVGIARWILNKVTDETQILVVEMGEHYENDIKDICEIAKPDIAVVTGINESHLERMKKMDTVIATVFEIVSNSKPGALVVLNADDRNVMENYKKFVWPDHKVIEYKVSSIKYKVFDIEKLCWSFEVDDIGKVDVNLLGEYALGDVDAAVKIGQSLAMSNEQIIAGIKNIKPVEHRLQPIVNSATGVLVIDDSYNGNSDGVAEAIKVLSRFKNRRKIYITPGLVEIGKSSADIHRGIGKLLAGVADVVILIKNSVTPWIVEGLSSSGVILRPQCNSEAEESQTNGKEILRRSDALTAQDDAVSKKPQIIWFNSALEAHAGLKDILKPGDVILFQNDWGDQYL